MIFRVDKRIYDDECIANTVYWLSSRFIIKRSLLSYQEEIIDIKSSTDSEDTALEKEFWTSLNDYKLRGLIAKDTKDIRTILYAKAFSECDDITEDELNEV